MSEKLDFDNSGTPSVAIVIPIINEAKVLPDTLKSLHGLPVDELVFVDGGSTDSSRALIAAQNYQCLISPPGRAKQMNLGAHSTRSDIILFLHADTRLSSSHILNIKKSYIEGFSSGRFDIRFADRALTYRIISFFINVRSRLTKVSTGDQAMFVRRELFMQLEGFKDIPLMEDIELSKRLRAAGNVKCLTDKVVTSNRRWQNFGIARTVLLMWKLRLLFFLGVPPAKLALMYRGER